MRIPSRVYVGVVVFGLIASISVAAYLILLLVGYQPPADAPHQLLFPEEGAGRGLGETLFTVVALMFCIAFTVIAWRSLLVQAREDVQFFSRREELKAELRRRQEAEQDDSDVLGGYNDQGPPGGYS